MPAGPSLSFPPVVSGNPVSCFFVPLFVYLHGGSRGFPINNFGHDRGGLATSGMTEGLLWSLCHAPATAHPGPLPRGEREYSAARVLSISGEDDSMA